MNNHLTFRLLQYWNLLDTIFRSNMVVSVVIMFVYVYIYELELQTYTHTSIKYVECCIWSCRSYQNCRFKRDDNSLKSLPEINLRHKRDDNSLKSLPEINTFNTHDWSHFFHILVTVYMTFKLPSTQQVVCCLSAYWLFWGT